MGAHHIGPLHAMVLWPESPSDLCYSCAPLMVLHCYIDGVALFVDGVGAFLKSLNLQSNVFSIQSQHDRSFMFEFEIQEGDSNVWIKSDNL